MRLSVNGLPEMRNQIGHPPAKRHTYNSFCLTAPCFKREQPYQCLKIQLSDLKLNSRFLTQQTARAAIKLTLRKILFTEFRAIYKVTERLFSLNL